MNFLVASHKTNTDENEPIRSEYLDEVRLYAVAIDLAAIHAGNGVVLSRRTATSLPADLANNLTKLKQCYIDFSAAASQLRDIAPAAEWLVDNFAKAEQHVQQAINDLPSGYSRRLPKLREQGNLGRPRICDIAWSYLAHTDSRFMEETSAGFIAHYQQVTHLTIGELWAFAVYVRALLVENAARTSIRTLVSHQARDRGDDMLTRAMAEKGGAWDLPGELKRYPEHARLSLLVHLLRRVRDRRGLNPAFLDEVVSRLEAAGYSPDGAIAEENARQAANNLTMQNIFKSFTRVAELDWEKWFASVSLVDRHLSSSENYVDLDNPSKSLYRNAIEDLARHSLAPELEVAERTLELSPLDPGEALLGKKRFVLEQAIGYRQTPLRKARRLFGSFGLAGYAGAIAVLTLVFSILASLATGIGSHHPGLLAILALLALLPASDAAMALVNYVLTQVLRPVILPGFSFKNGIPASDKAMIAVPVMLSSFHGIEEMLDRLEDHFLSNRDANISYALLSDWRDADQERIETDQALFDAAVNGIAALNQRHATSQFMLFHRRRQWNSAESRWMGWERKRGKLQELNRLLRQNADTSFIHQPASIPPDMRYVIVLDADTKLPSGMARQLVGKMAHPLNAPAFDPASGRIASGYGIIQPRITVSLPEHGRGSIYQRIFAHNPGLDPYVFATSDTYQDVFGEGSFTGKGIYNIDAMEAAIGNRIPDNTLLSHDLLEGNFARSGLASDTQLVEDFPDSYLVDAARHHRWSRGDWQLLPWMVPPMHGLTALGWFKMADNIRRSLLPVAMLLALLAGWVILAPYAAWGWTIYLLALMFIPIFLPIFIGSSLRREEITMGSELRTLGDDIANSVAVMVSRLILLVHQFRLQLSAMMVTFYRLAVSRRHLLEWTTMASLQSSLKPSLPDTFRLMWESPAIGLLVLAGWLLASSSAPVSGLALPFAMAWVFAPVFAYLISQPDRIESAADELPADVAASLRGVALQTWRFFDIYVNDESNMLPPDNVQEVPVETVAHRTSPTNIGLYLLSAVSARDLGWIGADDAAARITQTLDQAEKLERFRGHFLNWHDTRTLRPLEPRYVSSVDSGNLAGHLVATANALEKWTEVSGISALRLEGICDCARQVGESIDAMAKLHRRSSDEARNIDRQITALIAAVREMGKHLELVPLRILGISVQISSIGQSALRLMNTAGEAEAETCRYWLAKLRLSTEAISREVMRDEVAFRTLDRQLRDLAVRCRDIAYAMDFRFLFNPQRQLLSIGYRVGEEALDESCYDLLASEATLTSYFAIAKGDLDVEHWHKLGRPVTGVNNAACLISWSGSMFEYLMPHIVMRAPEQTLYWQTLNLAVRRQVAYGKETGTPWGVSESAYAARDLHLTYQYSNFGVPGLGLKRGLGENLVVAPYATGLASMINPSLANQNYQRLSRAGGHGRFGYFEAIDYTPARLPVGQKLEVIRSYFAHHQGMTITSIHNAVSGGQLRACFHAENTIRAAELLLQERAPHHLPVKTTTLADSPVTRQPRGEPVSPSHALLRPRQLASPATAVYSNGRMSAMIAADGSGYLTWKGIAINRWRSDRSADPYGVRIMVRRGSAGVLHPMFYSRWAHHEDDHGATFHQDKVEFFSHHRLLECGVEYFLSPDSDAEVRRLSITNRSEGTVTLEFTSYMELALAQPAADIAHPAFSKLFVHTEFDPDIQAVIATRRKRQATDPDIWTGHFLVVEGTPHGALSFETDRAHFLGRGNHFEGADAFGPGAQLSGATGYVLDPAVAFRQAVSVRSHDKARIYQWTVAAPTRDEVVALIRRHRSPDSYERIRTLAWTHARIGLRHISIAPEEATLFQRLTANLVYSLPDLRPAADAIAAGMGPQSALWPFSISGNRPIILVRIDDVNDLPFVQQLLKAQDYWTQRGLLADLVILNDSRSSYVQDLQAGLDDLAYRARARRSTFDDQSGEQIFILRGTAMMPEAINALAAAAHVVFFASHGPLRIQMDRQRNPTDLTSRKQAPRPLPDAVSLSPGDAIATDGLLFFNGYGGFDPKSLAYVIHHHAARPIPAPWINVIANESLGTHCSAEGGGYTWFGNSKEQQITPWSNDPVLDRPGESFFIRNVKTDMVASPTVFPLGRRPGRFTTRHAFGSTTYEAREQGLSIELIVTVHRDKSVKLSRLRLRNDTTADVELTVSYLAELAMGASREVASHFVTSELDAEAGAIFVQNRFNLSFANAIVYCGMLDRHDNAAARRDAALGLGGSVEWPVGLLTSQPLLAEFGGGFDPCLALRKRLMVRAQSVGECTVFLGAAADRDAARRAIAELRTEGFEAAYAGQSEANTGIAARIRIETPDKAFNTVMNGWLLYQALVGRFFARSGFYQASGAYGFRDQLQDSMAVAYVRPDLTRRHILRAASRQFIEGDVQHWWLPETGAGVRTHISDDTAWLAYCTAHYIEITGDHAILDEQIAFLEGAQVPPQEHDAFYRPAESARRATLYEHCVLALSRNLARGNHGLPLMGTGDWNDGMNAVGEGGRGESIWLAWFLCATLSRFSVIARNRGDVAQADRWQVHVDDLARAIDDHGWDGKWYRRAYFDDGTPLGTAEARECRIDSIAQSWSVLSGVAQPEKARAAMASLQSELIDESNRLALLFRPPFAQHQPSPGYIQSYPPGVRENGGQYTHGAMWAIFALAELGETEKAAALFALVNPVNHARVQAEADLYRVEPYVVAADVYGAAPFTGRGGWTWYTGAAGWLYRAGLEAILGMRLSGSRLTLKPCIPAAWPGFTLKLNHQGKQVNITAMRQALSEIRGARAIAPGQQIDIADLAEGSTIIVLLPVS